MRFGTASKFALTVFLCFCAFLLTWEIRFGFSLAIIISEEIVPSFRPLSEQSHRAYRRLIMYLVGLAGLIIGLNGLFIGTQGSTWTILGLKLYDQGILFGMQVSSRLILLALSIMLFFVSTSFRDLTSFLATLGLPSSVVSILLLSTHFLAQLPGRINQVFWAQEARGAPVRADIYRRAKSFSTILGPLVLSSIVESVERGISLELRGFRGGIRLSKSTDPMDNRIATMIILLTILLIIISLLWK